MIIQKAFLALVTAAFLTAGFSLSASAALITCAECGMTSDPGSPFTARIIDNGKELYFCDIGDLFVYLNRKKAQGVQAQVKDFPSGEWFDARAAHYVQSKTFNSPMGWGIAAFKDRKQTTENRVVMDFEGVLKAVR
jgi:copper chaperone NosL